MRALPLEIACWSVGLGLMAGGVVSASSPGCDNTQFSAEVLSRFPRVAEVCLEVISRGGQDYGVLKAQLDRVRGNTLRLRFKYPDDTHSAPIDIATRPDFRVLIDGEPTRTSDVAVGQELTVYVPVDQPYVALAPAAESEPLRLVPLPDSAPAPK